MHYHRARRQVHQVREAIERRPRTDGPLTPNIGPLTSQPIRSRKARLPSASDVIGPLGVGSHVDARHQLAGLASLAVAGGALAAATGLLSEGESVPPSRDTGLAPVSGQGFVLASLRVPDPDGGPPWALGTYEADPATAAPAGASPDIAEQFKQRLTCLVVGRTQNDQLGVVGRDGVFDNDGAFHRLSPAAQSSGVCVGKGASGVLRAASSEPPRPASGYSGAPGPPIGGCRERVNLDGPTVSPQTRRRLKGVPQCLPQGLRHVVAGFAGQEAIKASISTRGLARTQKLDPAENGAYLFVIPAAGHPRPELTFTLRDGRTCRPLAVQPRPPATAAKTSFC